MNESERLELEHETLIDLLRMLNPTQDARSAGAALVEATRGCTVSLSERFNVPRAVLRQSHDIPATLFGYLDEAGVTVETEQAWRDQQHARIVAGLLWPWGAK